MYRIVLSLLLLALPLSFVSVCAPRAGYGDDFPAIFNNEQDEEAEPLSPDEAVARMELPEGFSVTVFAAEPDVQNPIAMAWDDRGRMWVAENYTYSDKTQRFDLALRDRVLIFADEDNDGRAESRKVFADDVQMLTSVELGRGGVWLMCPPQLLFIPDQDGDDVPDGPPQVVLDGFTVAKSNYHNFANGLRWGPDGWLYGRCGHSCPGRIGTPGTPDARRIPLDGGMWRYHPDRQIVEVLCHGTTNPWGHDWDRHGELFFINTVIGHLWHVNPGSHFKESFGDSLNPAVYERMDMIADHYHFDTTGHWSESRDGKANDLGGGHAHIGMMIYQGERWPQQYRDKLFTLNMHGRRANVERLERRGAGYTALHEPDFLLAGDPFFRGIEIAVGPDRNAFILDWSDTGECHDHTGVHRTSGRIYKISYGHEDASDRMSFAKPLCLAGAGKLPQLWRDYQADAVSPQALRALLRDPDEHVRAWAVRLLVDFWPLDTVVGPLADATYPHDDATHAELLRLAREETSGLVRLTLASTLQRMPSGRRGPLAMELVKDADYANDRDLPLLVWYGLIPLGEHDPAALVDVARQCRWPTTLRAIARYLASRIESHPGPLDALLSTAPSMPEVLQRSVLAGMHDAFRGWRKVPQPASWPALVRSNLAQSEPELMRELRILFGDGRALDEIRHIALDKAAEMSLRRRALKTLIDGRPDDLREVCESLLNVRTLNADAARGLALFDDPAIGRRLARAYHRFHPNDRPVVLETLVSRPQFAAALLELIGPDKGEIPGADVTAYHARQIQGFGDESLSARLEEVWGRLRDSPAERKQEMERLRREITTEKLAAADLSTGRVLFEKTCAQCHRLYGQGETIGPDLTGSQRSNLDYLVENVVDPSAVVGKDYHMTLVLTADGRALGGLLVSENEKSLVLQMQTERLTIPVDEVDDVSQSPLSPMPDGMLSGLSDRQIRDLFAYLMHPRQVALPAEAPSSAR